MLKVRLSFLQLFYLGDDALSITLDVNRQSNSRFELPNFWSPEFNSSLEFDSFFIPTKNSMPLSLEFLDSHRFGLTSYFVHGDLSNSRGIEYSSRNNSLDSIGGGNPERERPTPSPPPTGRAHFQQQEFKFEHIYIIEYITLIQISELQKFFLILKKILTVLPADNTLHRNNALL